ncbi:glycoside hydrolase family 16 protein [Methylolobus aquaticus]|nr:glycoside hydrolase family 16 protein [Methylolobus aquaticus]
MEKFLRIAYFVTAVLSTGECYCVESSVTDATEFQLLSWDRSHAGIRLNREGLSLTFSDEFDAFNIVPDGGKGLWYAPIHGPFGAGKFAPPTPQGPFFVEGGVLRIRAEEIGGDWRSGLMQSVDSHGRGFGQRYGYFEMRARFPVGKGAWPAFWLKSQTDYWDKSLTRAEIDIVEWYGGDPKGHHSAVHLWPASKQGRDAVPLRHVYKSHYYNVSKTLEDGELRGWHVYGAEVTADSVIVYFDDQEVARFPTVEEFRRPLYMLVDLAIFRPEALVAQGPKDMFVDYVRVYKR